MKTRIALLLMMLGVTLLASAATVTNNGNYTRYTGSGSNSGDTLFTTGDLSAFDACVLMSTTGSVSVYAALDGVNYSTTAVALQDLGATDNSSVTLTVALRLYGFVGKYSNVVVKQVGSSAAAASINCWKN